MQHFNESPSLIGTYQSLLQMQSVEVNAAQSQTISALEPYFQALSTKKSSGLLWFRSPTKQPFLHNGFYLYGDVGRGKSMIMDLFFQHIPIKTKLRIHFHQFMSRLHHELRELRKSQRSTNSKTSFTDKDSLLNKAADRLAKNITLLCFDELQVNNIVDAMMLGPLFQHLIDKGVFIIVTSNRPPSDLYKDGLQREHFLPFIAMIQQRFNVHELVSDKDFRMGRLNHIQTCYFHPLGETANQYITNAFSTFTQGMPTTTRELSVNSRQLHFSKTASDVLQADFYELCSAALGAHDYREIARNFSVILLTNIPMFTRDLKNEMLRFITLIDQLYEHHVKLICTANAPLEHLCSHDLCVFEFARTQSRLFEMQSNDYWQLAHQDVTA